MARDALLVLLRRPPAAPTDLVKPPRGTGDPCYARLLPCMCRLLSRSPGGWTARLLHA